MKKIIITLNIFILLSCSQQDESITSEEITYEYSPQASLDLYVQGHRFIDQGKYKEAQKASKVSKTLRMKMKFYQIHILFFV